VSLPSLAGALDRDPSGAREQPFDLDSAAHHRLSALARTIHEGAYCERRSGRPGGGAGAPRRSRPPPHTASTLVPAAPAAGYAARVSPPPNLREVREHRGGVGHRLTQPPPLSPRLRPLGMQPASRHRPTSARSRGSRKLRSSPQSERGCAARAWGPGGKVPPQAGRAPRNGLSPTMIATSALSLRPP
jgi:hypothetical protein